MDVRVPKCAVQSDSQRLLLNQNVVGFSFVVQKICFRQIGSALLWLRCMFYRMKSLHKDGREHACLCNIIVIR